jgi:hypothetical protein
MKSILTLVAICGMLVVPSALAANGNSADSHHGSASGTNKPAVPAPRCSTGGTASKKLPFILRGALSGYVSATAAAPGKVTITVSDGNCVARAFKGAVLTFSLGTSTRVVRHGAIADGDRGSIDVRSTRGVDAQALALLTPRMVIDQATHA